jgi:hypothetical protein
MNSALRTFVLGGVLGAGVVSGGALAFAQSTGTSVPPATEVPGTVAPGTVPDPVEPPAGTPGTPAPGPGDEAEPVPPADGHRRLGKGGHQGRGHLGKHLLGRLGAGVDQLAAELGVSADQLREAHKAARQAVHELGKPERPSTRPPSDEDKAKLAAELKARAELYAKTVAEKLGVTPERLREASVAVVSKHLDEAVSSGKLSREQADKILDRVRNGVDMGALPGGHGRGHR